MLALQNKHVLLGVTGGIAAYKSAELIRLLQKAGASVRVVMTEAGQAFITPLTLQALSGHPVHTQLLDPAAEAGMGHIELSRWADLIIVAPASADFIAKLAAGRGDDLLTTVCLASQATIAIAPAMNQGMWHNQATQHNLQTIIARKMIVWGPAAGAQACGDVGLGRMLEPVELVELAKSCFATGSLAGRSVVITAGPTQEPLDPVRYLSNHSSGKMGYALAQAAVEAGARTVLITGPSSQPVPERVELVSVVTAEEMLAASLAAAPAADVFIAAAAVADYRPVAAAEHKIKKGSSATVTLELVKNPDIVATIAALPNKPFTVGFAAETRNLEEHAQRKLVEKNLDIIIANDVSDSRIGFNSDENAVLMLDASGALPLTQRSKTQLARDIVDELARRLAEHVGCRNLEE